MCLLLFEKGKMNKTKIVHENVNGVALSLTIVHKNGPRNAKEFIIAFQNSQTKSSWSKSLLLAIAFHIVALFFMHINLITILIIISISCFFLLLWITHSVQSETLLIIPLVGIQSTVKYVYGREANFIPWSAVDDVIINEVIHLNRVLYYLTVLVKDNKETKLVPIFKNTKPRLFLLESIYSEIQQLLDGQQRNDTSKGSGDIA